MAIYRIYPEKDSFIYSEVLNANAGLDEILEVAGYVDHTGKDQVARTLVKFSDSEINNILNNEVSGNFVANLHLYLAEATSLATDYTIYSYPVSDTFDNGTGKFGDVPVNKSGVSWKYRSSGEEDEWITNGFSGGVTGSFKGDNPGGGTWITGSNGTGLEASQSFSISSDQDLDIDVTNIVSAFYSQSVVNNGFLLKLENDLEFTLSSSMRLKYFSRDTNTIYPPYLEFKWDDSNYITGSLSTLDTSVATISIKNNKNQYIDEGVQRFRLSARPTYPTRTFTTSSIYLTNFALPENSYWGVKDEYSEEMIVDFDTSYTKISCDESGPYFDVHFDTFQPERYYRILIKTTLDGSNTIIDNKNIFKVTRNG